MTIQDLIILLPIAFGIIWGVYKGFFRELASILCVVVGIFAARYFGDFLSSVLVVYLNIGANIAKSVSCFVIFVVAIILLNTLANILTKISKIIKLGWINRLLGGFVGGLKWFFIVSVLLNITSIFYEKIPIGGKNKLAKSQYYKPVESGIDKILPLINFEDFKLKKYSKE